MTRRRQHVTSTDAPPEVVEPAREPEPEAVSEPVDMRRHQRLALAFVVAVSFLVYLRTLAVGMHFGDGPELAAAAHVLGVPHPTGYPFFMLLLKAFSAIPLPSELITRTALFSALSAAAAVGAGFVIILRATGNILSARQPKTVLIAAACAAAASAFLRFHWWNAVVTEVYSLQLLLTLAFLVVADSFSRSGRLRHLIASAAILGLALTHHRMSVFLLIPAAIAFVAGLRHIQRDRRLRATAIATAVVVACLSIYLYLPLRARTHPAINWGDPSTPASFIGHVRGTEYLQFFFLKPSPDKNFTADTYALYTNYVFGQIVADFAGQFASFPQRVALEPQWNRQFLRPSLPATALFCVLLPLMITGLISWVRSGGLLSILALLVAVQNVGILFLYTIRDIRDYYLYFLWFGWVCAFLGIAHLANAAIARMPAKRLRQPEFAYLFALLPAAVIACNWSACDQSKSRSAEEYSYMILPPSKEIMPENSILLTGGDHDIFGCWYRQIVRRERTDVLVFGSNFVYMPWYRTFFSEEQLRQYGLQFGNRVPADPRELVDRLAQGVIDRNLKNYPVFTSTTDPYVLKELSLRYRVTPVARMAVDAADMTMPGAVLTLYRIQPKDDKETRG